ncbi:MAG: FAD:protein FMN transferase [Candidatus Marinimicrobia bacterium]|nr:FAD:protein FMN transferase [Candidatus Neomarinimicrobiota bacterium]MBT4176907.1 FAD:protein FMN transferase [Candidatus Neomarinimicrobiota bacterium]MBT4593668.1 FAD:protein FMN transferase [Candidatus Neomarinimicrobiota bacterium]MBT4990213.1 FAD:protein FMN transferase [Candidatus Neomarinimicrobiota bacterium]MBT5356294.1 FAD:protein FMN transferase [Candidatus Neomarinimicrobiota bacterium]
MYYRFPLKKAQLLLGFLILFQISCQKAGTQSITGRTMGTTYEIIFGEQLSEETLGHLENSIDSILININQEMSVYISESNISLFNKKRNILPSEIPNSFKKVIERSLFWFKETGGAFDITVMPLVNLWGFGTKEKIETLPDIEKIHVLMASIGSDYISLNGNLLIKNNVDVQIDLGAVAKGFAVDVIAEFLERKGVRHYFVEIGGEINCEGKNREGKIWTIGIQTPKRNSLDYSVIKKIKLKNRSIATSGDYKNFVEINGKFYSHAINPKTGYPVESQVASVSVIAPNCMDADALATGLMIMPLSEGKILVKKFNEMDAMWILRNENGLYNIEKTSGFNFD